MEKLNVAGLRGMEKITLCSSGDDASYCSAAAAAASPVARKNRQQLLSRPIPVSTTALQLRMRSLHAFYLHMYQLRWNRTGRILLQGRMVVEMKSVGVCVIFVPV